MGRKSSAKVQNRQSAAGAEPPSPQPTRSRGPLLAAAVLVVIAIGAIAYVRSAQPTPASAPSTPMTPIDPPEVNKSPHPQDNLPPLPFDPEPPARPMDVVRSAYKFAAEHPEVLSYVPCYCGCERAGHRGNEDCFVTRRKANGDVDEWEPHGMTWAVCLDVARDAMQMHDSGASVRDIRAANEKKWSGSFQNHTPTPQPPAK